MHSPLFGNTRIVLPEPAFKTTSTPYARVLVFVGLVLSILPPEVTTTTLFGARHRIYFKYEFEIEYTLLNSLNICEEKSVSQWKTINSRFVDAPPDKL